MPGWTWQEGATGLDEKHPVRRVVGIHEIRFDGLSDLLLRAHGASVFDVGCNRGHLGWDFACNGASVVHGCDIYGPGIACARAWFAEHPHIENKFEAVNLEEGAAGVNKAFGNSRYDIVLFMGTTHKLKRVMEQKALSDLVRHLAQRSIRYFAWAGYREDLKQIDEDAKAVGLVHVHTSELAKRGQPAAIWVRD